MRRRDAKILNKFGRNSEIYSLLPKVSGFRELWVNLTVATTRTLSITSGNRKLEIHMDGNGVYQDFRIASGLIVIRSQSAVSTDGAPR